MGDVPSDNFQAPKDGVERTITPKEEFVVPQDKSDVSDEITSDPTQSMELPGVLSQSASSTIRHPSALNEALPQEHQRMNPIALNMSDMTSALPSFQSPSRPYSQQNMHMQFIPTHQSQGMMYLVHQAPYVNPNTAGNTMYNMHYSPSYHSSFVHQNPQVQGGFSPYSTTSHFQHPHHQSGASLHSQSPGYHHGYHGHHHFHHPYNEMPSDSSNSRLDNTPQTYDSDFRRSQLMSTSSQGTEKQKGRTNYDVSSTIVDGSSRMMQSRVPLTSGEEGSARLAFAVASNTPPRRPPRKPKQSGHALWVGNLPPSTHVMDLKDHFSKDAKSQIESVFLISKSNCAFVNYKTEAACAAAVARFHDSRFQGVRLVCRLRRGATSAISGQSNPLSARPGQEGEQEDLRDSIVEEQSSASYSQPASRVPNRYFVVKSLTLQDLELSRQSGIWATQTHNEEALNRAYESADNVYLIFSANKSGEYFGYARMMSPITDDEALALEAPQRPEHPLTEVDNLEVIPTEATETAPKGRIIDDSARGTIFWEADSSEDDGNEFDEQNEGSEPFEGQQRDPGNDGSDAGVGVAKDERTATEPSFGDDSAGGSQTFGKPFRIQWISTEKLPFFRTRGLRNPWNSNREVKIARDGTEIEPSVGRKLTQLFHVHSGVVSPGGQHNSGFQRSY